MKGERKKRKRELVKRRKELRKNKKRGKNTKEKKLRKLKRKRESEREIGRIKKDDSPRSQQTLMTPDLPEW